MLPDTIVPLLVDHLVLVHAGSKAIRRLHMALQK